MIHQSALCGSRCRFSWANCTMPAQSPFFSSSASFSWFGVLTPCMFLSRVVNVPSGISASARLAYGEAQPPSTRQPHAASRRRRPVPRLLFALIDVTLLCHVRLALAPQEIEVEPAVPPQRAPRLLLVDDRRLLREQLADHPRRVRFVAGLDLLSEHGAADYTRSRSSGASFCTLLT